jgi:alpha-N-arabinofuranosidase
VFRSDKVTGPYVPFAGNPILTQRDLPNDRTNPITSTGHASFVRTQRGDWWAVFLGVRPYDSAGNFNTGRETFMMPVEWKNGWPHITAPGDKVPWVAPRPNLPSGPKATVPLNGSFAVREDFSQPKLPPSWIMLRNPKSDWWRIADGTLRIDPKEDAFGARGNPSLLARRQQHLNATATTRVSFVPDSDGAEAGIIALQNDEYWYFLCIGRERGKPVIRLRRRAGEQEPVQGKVLASAPLPKLAPTQLRIQAHRGSYDFSWSADGRSWHRLLSNADGTVLSTKRSGGFVGAVLGVYAHR